MKTFNKIWSLKRFKHKYTAAKKQQSYLKPVCGCKQIMWIFFKHSEVLGIIYNIKIPCWLILLGAHPLLFFQKFTIHWYC